MVIDLALAKDRINKLLSARYDHKYLNLDTPPFDRIIPTPENVTRQLLADIVPLFDDQTARPVACHVNFSPAIGATAFADGRIERDFWLEFSAARRTWSPHLSEDENMRLFGAAASPSGHGHFYRLCLTAAGPIDPESGVMIPDNETADIYSDLLTLFDHRNLSVDVPELGGVPITTEYLARFIFNRLAPLMPVNRVRLSETPYFFAEYLGGDRHLVGIESAFQAAHRLYSLQLSDEENRKTYGKCSSLNGHGHRYRIEMTVAGIMDERSGVVSPLAHLQDGLGRALAPWEHKHLDWDTEDFTDKPSTGENILRVLWPKIESTLDHPLHRLRLWETPNNRFTLRRGIR